MSFYNIDRFDVSKQRLNDSKIKLTVKIHLKYPEIDKWLKFSPKNRRAKIDSLLKSSYETLLKNTKGRRYKRIGDKSSPRGIIIKLHYKQLRKIHKLKVIDSIFILKIDGHEMKKLKSKKRKSFISVMARIAIQIEGVKKGKQRYEDRIIIIKAKSCKSAKKKLQKEFHSYEKPYLNSSGRLVRWKLEKIINCYDTEIYNSDDFKDSIGKEVYSIIKKRKISPSLTWEKQWGNRKQLRTRALCP